MFKYPPLFPTSESRKFDERDKVWRCFSTKVKDRNAKNKVGSLGFNSRYNINVSWKDLIFDLATWFYGLTEWKLMTFSTPLVSGRNYEPVSSPDLQQTTRLVTELTKQWLCGIEVDSQSNQASDCELLSRWGQQVTQLSVCGGGRIIGWIEI